MSSDMTKIARHFVAVNRVRCAEKREKQTALVIIKLLPLRLWSITLLPPTERRTVSFHRTKECIQLRFPCFYSKYI